MTPELLKARSHPLSQFRDNSRQVELTGSLRGGTFRYLSALGGLDARSKGVHQIADMALPVRLDRLPRGHRRFLTQEGEELLAIGVRMSRRRPRRCHRADELPGGLDLPVGDGEI